MKNYHTIYIRRCRKVQKINLLRIRVHRYCELTYDTDDSCSTLYWKTHGTKQLLTTCHLRLGALSIPPHSHARSHQPHWEQGSGVVGKGGQVRGGG